MKRMFRRLQERIALTIIYSADDFLITSMIHAIIRRYSRLYPDWVVSFISMHKDPKLRKQDVDKIIHMLEQQAK